jgi:hypothetical protein
VERLPAGHAHLPLHVVTYAITGRTVAACKMGG